MSEIEELRYCYRRIEELEGKLRTVETEREEALGQNAAMRDELLKFEWSSWGAGGRRCPVCGLPQSGGKHFEICTLRDALLAVPSSPAPSRLEKMEAVAATAAKPWITDGRVPWRGVDEKWLGDLSVAMTAAGYQMTPDPGVDGAADLERGEG